MRFLKRYWGRILGGICLAVAALAGLMWIAQAAASRLTSSALSATLRGTFALDAGSRSENASPRPMNPAATTPTVRAAATKASSIGPTATCAAGSDRSPTSA